jgi:hydroxypyruvate reductase
VPDERSLSGTRKITGLLQDLDEHDLVFCLISGGGSALLACPAPGVSLEDLQELTKSLLSCGASIQEINTLRKHLDLVKGGGLLRMASPARVVTLVLSDVVGSSLETIASGPTVPDPSTFADAVRILKSYQLWESTPAGIIAHLEAGLDGKIAETLKPGDPLLDRSENILVGSNQVAALAALEQARQEGFNSLLLTTYLQGEASQAGKFLAAVARQVAASGAPAPRPACILAGGETTVTLRGSGLGGRNQEVALGAVESLAGIPGTLLVTLATDGEDATSGAAGAIVTGETLERARQAGLDPADSLRRNDSFHFFERLGDVLVTGPTGTNVNDLNFIFLFPEGPG